MRRGVVKLLCYIDRSRRIINNWTKPVLELITADLEIDLNQRPQKAAPHRGAHSHLSLIPASERTINLN
jgi:hypothetical protein